MLKSEPLYYLVELAHCNSFRIASENLHITQPALSIAIKKLEAELGVTLLERTTKSVRLTKTGEQVVKMSQQAIEQLEAIEQLAAKERLKAQQTELTATICRFIPFRPSARGFCTRCSMISALVRPWAG